MDIEQEHKMSLLETLKAAVADQLAKEGITQQLIDYMDLSVEWSPVIPFAGGGLGDAVAPVPWGFYHDDVVPEKFEVEGVHGLVSQESLKVMRLRYLLRLKETQRPAAEEFLAKLKAAFESDPAIESVIVGECPALTAVIKQDAEANGR